MEEKPRAIPVRAAREIANTYHYDQIFIIGRRVDDPISRGLEHVTTYGRNRKHCDIARRVGNQIKHKLMGWPEYEGRVPLEKLCKWAMDNGFATGHADTVDELLSHISEQVSELRGRDHWEGEQIVNDLNGQAAIVKKLQHWAMLHGIEHASHAESVDSFLEEVLACLERTEAKLGENDEKSSI